MTAPLYLVIDQGGHASRAIVFDQDGTPIAQGVAEIRAHTPQADWMEYEAEEVVGSVLTAISEAVAQLGERQVALRAAGLVTQRSNVVCWHRRSGAALSPIISWQDRRMAGWLRQFEDRARWVQERTGLFLTPHYGASKLRWCLDHLPQVQRAMEHGSLAWGSMASFLAFRLLRERPLLVDPANASRTQLLNVQTLEWDTELAALFGVALQPLPKVVPSCHHYGTLPVGGGSVPLTLLNGDQSAASFAFGAPDPETVYLNIGTGAFVQRIVPAYPGATPGLLSSVVMQDATQTLYALEGTVNGAGSALHWAAQTLGIDEHVLHAELPHWLAHSTNPPLFLNGVSGLGTPYWRPQFMSRFIGEGPNSEKIVAVIESVVFLIKENLDELARYTSPAKQIVVTGGMSVLDGLCQRLADVAGLDVARPEAQEATARGACYLLAGQPATWRNPGAVKRFAPQHRPALEQRFRSWRDAMREALS
ncbi:MAG: FGGY family carbohydrate kinase [Pseudomonadota bacterium]